MNTKRTLSITEARKRIFEIINEVQAPDVYYTLTEKGRSKAVIMSAEEFESWIETLNVYETFPNLAKDIEEAKEEYKRGDFVTLQDLLLKEGFVLADKPKKKYGIRNNRAKKGTKRTKKNKK